jgi:hypothetical protein
VTNTTSEPSTAPALVATSQQQAIHERSFRRLKTRRLQIRPVSLRDEQRIAGLLWLSGLAWRVLTRTAYRLRPAWVARQEALAGLNPARHSPTTCRPTTERVMAALANITLTTLTANQECPRHGSPLHATQRHILVLLKLPADLYAGLARPSPNAVDH